MVWSSSQVKDDPEDYEPEESDDFDGGSHYFRFAEIFDRDGVEEDDEE